MTDYIVHSRHDTTVHVKAKTAEGHEVAGLMPASIVELIPSDGAGPSLTLHRHAPTKEALDTVLKTFPVGGTVRMGDFSLIKPPAEEKAR